MKIFTRFPNLQEREQATLVWPDSCWLLSDRPLYVPDFAPEFVAIPMAAYKAGRLGKNIAPRFAGRYLAEFTAALCVMPLRAHEALMEGRVPPQQELCFDCCVVIGDWSATIPEGLEINSISPEAATETAWPAEEAAAETLANFSRTNTIKLGDVLMVPLPLDPIPVAEGSRIEILNAATRDKLLITRFK